MDTLHPVHPIILSTHPLKDTARGAENSKSQATWSSSLPRASLHLLEMSDSPLEITLPAQSYKARTPGAFGGAQTPFLTYSGISNSVSERPGGFNSQLRPDLPTAVSTANRRFTAGDFQMFSPSASLSYLTLSYMGPYQATRNQVFTRWHLP